MRLSDCVVEILREKNPFICHRGFWRTMRYTFSDKRSPFRVVTEKTFDDLRETYGVKILPDAYLIDREQQVVVVYEVEDTSRVERVLPVYAELALLLDHIWWDLCLVRIDTKLKISKALTPLEVIVSGFQIKDKDRKPLVSEVPVLTARELGFV